MTTLHDFGGVLGRPLDTFFCTSTISWSRLLARGQSGPHVSMNTYYTKYWVWCHMGFHVIMVTYLMILFMDKFMGIIILIYF